MPTIIVIADWNSTEIEHFSAPRAPSLKPADMMSCFLFLECLCRDRVLITGALDEQAFLYGGGEEAEARCPHSGLQLALYTGHIQICQGTHSLRTLAKMEAHAWWKSAEIKYHQGSVGAKPIPGSIWMCVWVPSIALSHQGGRPSVTSATGPLVHQCHLAGHLKSGISYRTTGAPVPPSRTLEVRHCLQDHWCTSAT